MSKTVHFAIGYPHYQSDNGNESLVHWDLIVDMRDGGKIYFDDVLVQKNGVFIANELKSLNFDETKSDEFESTDPKVKKITKE